MGVRENYLEVLNKKNQAALRAGRNPEDITLMAVTKLHTVDEINEAIDAGATDIGENKVQELLSKYEDVKPVRWHLIGHLQTNKVKQIIDKVVMIHSVDSLHLAEEINKRAGNAGLVMDILIEINVGEEETKTGIQAEELMDLAKKLQIPARTCGSEVLCAYPLMERIRKFPESISERQENSLKNYSSWVFLKTGLLLTPFPWE